jgi:hypothetical protein
MKKLKEKIAVTVEKTETGYSAYADDVNVFTTANEIPELYTNLVEALNLAFEDSGQVVSEDNIQLNLDLQQFFQHYRVLNAAFLAKRIGMNPTLLSQYVTGRKRASPQQTEKIICGIQRIGKELSDLQFIQR